MGEYFKPVNLTKKQQLHPHKFGDGLKYGEWVTCDSDTQKALRYLISAGGDWGGDDVRIVSDYADAKLYDQAEEEFEDVSYKLKEELGLDGGDWTKGDYR